VKQIYRVLAGLIALGVLVQAAAISFAWFDTMSAIDNGQVIDGDYEGNAGHAIHGIVGMQIMPLISLVLLIVSFFARNAVPGAVTWAAIVFGVTLLQVALAFAAFSAPVVGTLHGVNALALLGVAGRAGALTRQTGAAGSGTAAGAVPGQRTGPRSAGSDLPV
jgi:hypothetical protein